MKVFLLQAGALFVGVNICVLGESVGVDGQRPLLFVENKEVALPPAGQGSDKDHYSGFEDSGTFPELLVRMTLLRCGDLFPPAQ